MAGSEGPLYTLQGQAIVNVTVICDINVIIEVDKFILAHPLEYCKSNER
jgi:hypothetical protein